MRYLAAILLTLGFQAMAQSPISFAQSPRGDVLILMSDPCHLPVAGHPQRAFLRLRDGSTYTGCHRTNDGSVHLVFDDGDVWVVPTQAFKPMSSAGTWT